MKSFKSFESFKQRTLKDPKVKAAYDTLEPEYQLICAIIDKRLKEGITQKELARLIGTKQSAISRFERGDSNPSLAFMQKLAKGLGLKMKISFL